MLPTSAARPAPQLRSPEMVPSTQPYWVIFSPSISAHLNLSLAELSSKCSGLVLLPLVRALTL